MTEDTSCRQLLTDVYRDLSLLSTRFEDVAEFTRAMRAELELKAIESRKIRKLANIVASLELTESLQEGLEHIATVQARIRDAGYAPDE